MTQSPGAGAWRTDKLPIPFRDLSEDSDLGLAGFLRFEEEPGSGGLRAALFMINSRGEPVEFGFTRISVSRSVLWRSGDARRHAIAALARALFEACSNQPTLLLARAEEVHPRVFADDLEVQVPFCRVASPDAAIHSADELPELLSEATHLFWVGGAPEPDSLARRLLEALQVRQLLTEPFARASEGLQEAYNEL